MTHAILLVTNFSIMGREKQISLIKKREILTDKIKSRKDKAVYSFRPLCFILYEDFLNWLCPWVCNIITSITASTPSHHKENGIVFLKLSLENTSGKLQMAQF